MLKDDVILYSELTGNDGLHTPIGIIGAYLDGYERGKKDINKPEILACGEGELNVQLGIVRCKDCRYRDEYGCCKYWKALSMSVIPIAIDDDDFCSYAERREVTEC